MLIWITFNPIVEQLLVTLSQIANNFKGPKYVFGEGSSGIKALFEGSFEKGDWLPLTE